MTDVLEEIKSTKAQRKFGDLEGRAAKKDLAVKDHGRTKFMIVSPKRYAKLRAMEGVGQDRLQQLDRDFDAMVARMQGDRQAVVHDSLDTLPLGEILAAGAAKVAAGGGRKVRVTYRSRRVRR